MNSLLSNLLPLLLLGLAALFVSLWWPKDKFSRSILRGFGIVALVLVGGGIIYVVVSPPGGDGTIDQGKGPAPTPLPMNRLEPLRQNWNSEGYANWPVAKLLAELSEKAYLPPVDVEPALRDLGFDHVTTVVDSSMMGYVVSVDDVTVVVFRGTDNNVDWIVNLIYSSVPTPHGAVHKGFSDAYAPFKPQILKVLAQRKPKNLWITGHSLGGALAVVCAYDLLENQQMQVDGVITFGQPMIAHKQLADYLDTEEMLLGRYAHYVNDHDIVPRIPPGYNHFGSLVWFTGSGIKRSKPKGLFATKAAGEPQTDEIEELDPLSRREFEAVKAKLSGNTTRMKTVPDSTLVERSSAYVDDHSMSLYLEKIRAMETAAKPR